MKKVKIGIIGIGHLGAIHLKILSELKNTIELVGICDIKEDRTLKLAEHYKVPFWADYQSLLGKVDAVDICTPTDSHYKIAQFFLSNKIHTFIEKPICTSVEQAGILIKLAQKGKCKLQVGHIERFNTAFESVKHFTQDPLFIECHRLNHFPNRSLDIGVVMDLMIHDIDIILGIVKSTIQDVDAVGVPVLTPMEDIANARIKFKNGCTCNLTASRVSDDVVRKIRIFQKDTYISLDYVKQEAFIYKKHNHQILKHSLPIEKEQPLQRELNHFIDCIRNDKKPIVSGQEGKAALEVALQISRQIWKTLRKQSS